MLRPLIDDGGGRRVRRVAMTLDGVGGVGRYAVDLGRALAGQGVQVLFVGLGPAPSRAFAEACRSVPGATLVWTAARLDWMARAEAECDGTGDVLAGVAAEWGADLLHLNVPSQAADVPAGLPVVVASHSCVATWWQAVRGGPLPPDWQWQARRHRRGFDRAAVALAPSASHAAAVAAVYGRLPHLRVVPNATAAVPAARGAAAATAFAAGRWWDPAKNAAALDRAAGMARTPVLMAGPLTGPNGECVAVRHARPLGQLTADAVAAHMRRAAVFVAPSLYEPFGLAVLEAAAAGAALVLADIPTFRELWTGAAILVPPHDPAAFAAAIDGLAADARRRRALGVEARRRAAAFTLDRQAAATLAAYAAATAAASREVA